jgi:hypothetical protein
MSLSTTSYLVLNPRPIWFQVVGKRVRERKADSCGNFAYGNLQKFSQITER